MKGLGRRLIDCSELERTSACLGVFTRRRARGMTYNVPSKPLFLQFRKRIKYWYFDFIDYLAFISCCVMRLFVLFRSFVHACWK